MTITLNEKTIKAHEKIAKLERQRRLEGKKEREAMQKKDQRRCYIIGELVVKYFPELLDFEPGTNAKNLLVFEPLETVLSLLSSSQELMSWLKEEAKRKSSANSPQEP